MKITNNVISKYMELCPLSTNKCKSYSEIEYKIIRAVDLRKVTNIISNGKTVVGYYNNRFVLDNGVVVDMYKEAMCVHVSEELKDKHYNMYYKVVV